MKLIINFSFAGNLTQLYEKQCKQKYDKHFELAKQFAKLFRSEIQNQQIELNYFIWHESLEDARKYTPELADYFQAYEDLLEEDDERFFKNTKLAPNDNARSTLDFLKQEPIMYKDFGTIFILYKKGGMILDNTFIIQNENSQNENEFKQKLENIYHTAQNKDFLPLLKLMEAGSERLVFPSILLSGQFSLECITPKDMEGILETNRSYIVPANEVCILFGKKESLLVSYILEYYIKFSLQLLNSEKLDNRAIKTLGIGSCIILAINNAFIQYYLNFSANQYLLKSEDMRINLVHSFIKFFYIETFNIRDGFIPSINLKKVSQDSWR